MLTSPKSLFKGLATWVAVLTRGRGWAGTVAVGGVGFKTCWGEEGSDDGVLEVPEPELLTFAEVLRFKDPSGLPGPRFLCTLVGRLLSEGSNTILAL